MLDLNIRNMPEGLIKRLKVQAAMVGQPLRQYVIESLSHTVTADEEDWKDAIANHKPAVPPTASQQAQQRDVAATTEVRSNKFPWPKGR